jgi:predicted methyltransferase
MGFLSVLSQAHRWVAERAGPGDAAVDATAGNGVDTLFLARTVGPRGRVFAFDVQEAALARTRERLEKARPDERQALAPVTLLLAGHERMREHIPAGLRGRIRAVMFNLGYLPGADPAIITRPSTTIAAMQAALGLLQPGGVLTAVLYPGHPGGDAEAEAVERWIAEQVPPSAAQAVLYRFPHRPKAPYLMALEKKEKGRNS